MSKHRPRWSDQHLTQLRVQMEAFKEIMTNKDSQVSNNGRNLTVLQLAAQRQQEHDRQMDSYKEKFDIYNLDYLRLASRFSFIMALNLIKSLPCFILSSRENAEPWVKFPAIKLSLIILQILKF